jgi:PAS domain S-box-containing protein
MTPLRLLLHGCSPPETAAALESLRTGGYEPNHQQTNSIGELAEQLENATWELILTDHSMPKCDAFNVLALGREFQEHCPVIVYAGPVGEETAAGLIRAGADEFVLKGHMPQLLQAIARQVGLHGHAPGRTWQSHPREPERWQQALSAAGMDLFEWDIQKNRIFWSSHAHDTFGLPAGAFGGTMEDFSLLLHPEDRPSFNQELQGMLADGGETSWSRELRIQLPDGQQRWVFLKSRIYRNKAGEAVRLLGLGQEITYRKKTEEALRASEKRFSQIFLHSPSIMFLSSLKGGRILDANHAFTSALGYAREEVIGQTEQVLGLWADPDARAEIPGRLELESPLQNVRLQFISKSGAVLKGDCSFISIELDRQDCLLTSITDVVECLPVELLHRARHPFPQPI